MLNRLDRLTAILIQLQSKRVVRAQEIAERFGISLRTVYRDVRSLETAGVPVIGEAGIGYSLLEGYRLPPVQFTADEATALLTAEKLVSQYTDVSVSSQYNAALLKIKAVLRLSEKDALEQLDEAVMIVTRQKSPTGDTSQTLSLILHALAHKEVLSIQYKGRKDENAIKRNIEPIGVFFKNEAWYVVAWCQLREDVRNFRLDLIQQAHQTGSLFESRDISLQDFLDEAEARPLQASITIPNEVLPFIAQQKNRQGFISEKTTGDFTEMYFHTASYEYLARFAMQFADKVVCFEPPALALAFREILDAAQKKLQSPKSS